MCKQTEVAIYIVNRFFAFALCGNCGLPKRMDSNALKKVGYTIKTMSVSEIFLSFILIICDLIIFASIPLLAYGVSK